MTEQRFEPLENGDFMEILTDEQGRESSFYRARENRERVGYTVEVRDYRGVLLRTEPLPVDELSDERLAQLIATLRTASRAAMELEWLADRMALDEDAPGEIVRALRAEAQAAEAAAIATAGPWFDAVIARNAEASR